MVVPSLIVVAPRAASAFPPKQKLLLQRFGSAYRLKNRADFAALKRGRRLIIGGMRLVYQSNTLGYARLGLAVSRKFGNAVHRNRLKRQLREAFRKNSCRNTPFDILAIPLEDNTKLVDPVSSFSQGLQKIAQAAGKQR